MGSPVIYLNDYREGLVEKGSVGWENESVVMEA